MISLVYAQSRNGIIGDAGTLPWHVPSDLKRFKEVTLGNPVVMGRKTWGSLPRQPLPGRLNIVLTRQTSFAAVGAIVVHSVDDALTAARGQDEICVIGGADIFTLFLPLADRIYLTEIDMDVAGDTPAPALSPNDWREVSATPLMKGEKDEAAFRTRVLERVRQS
jgi:dihydrofolate reductase